MRIDPKMLGMGVEMDQARAKWIPPVAVVSIASSHQPTTADVKVVCQAEVEQKCKS